MVPNFPLAQCASIRPALTSVFTHPSLPMEHGTGYPILIFAPHSFNGLRGVFVNAECILPHTSVTGTSGIDMVAHCGLWPRARAICQSCTSVSGTSYSHGGAHLYCDLTSIGCHPGAGNEEESSEK